MTSNRISEKELNKNKRTISVFLVFLKYILQKCEIRQNSISLLAALELLY